MIVISGVLSAVLPVFFVVGCAYLIRRKQELDVRTLATLNIYVFIPALVFSGLSEREIQWGLFGRFAAAVALLVVIMTVVLTVVARARSMSQDRTSAFQMTMFTNLGNFGLPVVLFAFGETEALPLAIIVLVCGSLFQNSLGVYFAQRSRHSAARAFLRVFRFPMIYAFLVALVFQRLAWEMPKPLSQAVRITADAAIPVQLMILGFKVAETRLDTGLDVFLATFMRLCVGPAVAFFAAWFVGLGGLALKVFVLQLSGPVAVGMAVYGVQFDVCPRFLASVVSWTFIFSIVSVSTVLAILYAM